MLLLCNHKTRPKFGISQLKKLLVVGILFGARANVEISAFTPVSKSQSTVRENTFLARQSVPRIRKKSDGNDNEIRKSSSRASSTALNVLLEVPEYFFTFTFPMLGILLSISKGFARLRLEESAWEQRLEEAREARLRDDPTLTELELRRKEASLEWSAYGKPRRQEEEREQEMKDSMDGYRNIKVAERDDLPDENERNRNYCMSKDEIYQFEMEYGIEYDPYYDDPYTEDELPVDIEFKVDKKYGDRIYENGEIFYKDKSNGLFYRQGAKPKNLSFW